MAGEESAIFDSFLSGSESEEAALGNSLSQTEFYSGEGFNPVGVGETFKTGVRAGVSAMDTDLNYFLALGNQIMGDEEGAAERVRRARMAENESGNALAGVQNFDEFLEAPTVTGFFDQVLTATGQISPMAIGAIGTSVTGALVGASAKLGANAMTRATTKKLVNDVAEKQAKFGFDALDADEKAIMDIGYGLASSAKRGGIGGAFLQEYPMMAGGSFGEFDEAGVDLDTDRAFQSLAIGAPLAAVGVAGEAFIVKSLANLATKKARKQGNSVLGTYAKNILAQGLQGGATEAATEVVQEGAMIAQRMSVDEDYTAQQAQLRLGQAAFAGFFGGKAMSGAGAAVAGIPAAANQMLDAAYDGQISDIIEREKELADLEQQLEMEFVGEQPTAPVSPEEGQLERTPGAREMELREELDAFFSDNPEQDPRNIDQTDDEGSQNLDTESPVQFNEATTQEGLGTDQIVLQDYQPVTPDRRKNNELFNQRFDLLNNFYEQRGYTDADGVSLLEPYRNEMSDGMLNALIKRVAEDRRSIGTFTAEDGNSREEFVSDNTYFVEPITKDGQRRLALVAVPTDTGRRSTTLSEADPETGENVSASLAQFVGAAVTSVVRGIAVEDAEAQNLPDVRVVMDGKEFRQARPVDLKFLAGKGIQINTRDESSLQGEGLTDAQKTKLGLIRMVKELTLVGAPLQFEGRTIDLDNLTPEQADIAVGRFTLGELLSTPDPIPAESARQGVAQERRVDRALARQEFDEDIGAIRQKYVDQFVARRAEMRERGEDQRAIDRMGANLKAQMAAEIAAFTEFDPNDISDRARVRTETDQLGRTRRVVDTDTTDPGELDSLNDPLDRAEQDARRDGTFQQEQDDLFVPARERDPNYDQKAAEINERFDARREAVERVYARDEGPAPIDRTVKEARERKAVLVSEGLSETEAQARVFREYEVTAKEIRDLETSREVLRERAKQGELAKIELEREAELADLDAAPAVETKLRPTRLMLEMMPEQGQRMVGSSLSPQDARLVGNAQLNKRENAGTTNNRRRGDQAKIVLNGDLGSLAGRVFNTANELFKFRKPVHVFTLSDLKQNFDRYVGGRGMYAPITPFLQESITRMEDTTANVPGRMVNAGNAYVIVVRDSDGSGTFDDARMGAVLAHELGHALFDEELVALENRGNLRKRLFDEYKKDLATRQFVPSQYEGARDVSDLGFEEWYADQVAAYVYDKSKSASTGTQSYFKRVAAKLKRFFKRVNEALGGRLQQADFMEQYFDRVAEAHKRKLRVIHSETAEIGWAQREAIREMSLDMGKEIDPELIKKVRQMSDQTLRSGTYKFFNRHLSSVDGWLRDQGPAGVALAQFFYGKSQSKEDAGFHKEKNRKNNEFNNELAGILGINFRATENVWDTPEIKEILLEVEDETRDTDTLSPKAQQVRKLLDKVYDEYITNPDTGRPWFKINRRRNYSPRMLDFVAIQQNPEKFEQLLRDRGISERRIEAVMEEVKKGENESQDIESNDQDGRSPEELAALQDQARMSPGMDSRAVRTLSEIPTTALREAGFLTPPGQAIVQYFHQITRKVEFERRGGYKRIKELLDQMDPNEKLFSVGSTIGRRQFMGAEVGREEQLNQRTATEDAIMAQLGKVGAGMNPHWRTVNSIGAVHTALTTLLFTVFASVTDLAGIVMRSKDLNGVTAVYDQAKQYFTDKEELQQFAADVGVISMDALENMFIATGELDFANKTARNVMAKFFQYTGLNWYTRYTRILATGAARQFLVRTANKKDFGSREQRYLDELGVSRDEVRAWEESGFSFEGPAGERLRSAVYRFADESIIRPSAAERPTWASNPYFTLVWQLKSYFYAYGKTVLGGMGREINNRYKEDGNFEGGAMLALLAVGTMMPLTMAGLELREYFKWGFQAILPGVDATDRVFRSDRMDTGEYLFEIFERSGALGPWSLALTSFDSIKWEGPLGPIIANIPFVDAFDDTLLDGDWTRPIPVLNNVK